MNMTVREGHGFLAGVGRNRGRRQSDPVSPYTTMAVLAEEFVKRRIVFGPQNFHEQDSGAFTGEISLPMIQELGCSCLLAGAFREAQLLRGDRYLHQCKSKKGPPGRVPGDDLYRRTVGGETKRAVGERFWRTN